MTTLFTEGDKVAGTYPIREMESRTGIVFHGMKGSDLLFKIDEPTDDEVRAFAHGPIALGLRDEGGTQAKPTFLLNVGVPGTPGSVEEATVEARGMVSNKNLSWWSDDIELGLVDRTGVCRKRRPFRGPTDGLKPGPLSFSDEDTPHVAVFADEGFGLTQPHGPLTVDVIVSGGCALPALPDWRPGLDEVWDLQYVTAVDIAPSRVADLFSVEARTQEALRGTRTMCVLPDSPRSALAVVSEFYRAVAESVGRSIVVFQSPSKAAEALGVDRIPTLGGAEAGSVKVQHATAQSEG